MITYIIIGILALFAILLIKVFNELAKERVQVQEGWSGISAFLQQRSGIILHLVEIVEGYAGHGNKTLVNLTKACNKSIAALTPEAQIEAATNMNASMIDFKAFSKQYPGLKANENFLRLQEQLTDMENRINQNRRYYNGAVREYNQRRAVFPRNIVSAVFGFKEAAFFAKDAAAKPTPKISFS